jgi:uncharacterized protein (TIGR02265 family)
VAVDLGRVEDTLDLARRLTEVPESAAVRGVFFNSLEEHLRRQVGLDPATTAAIVGPHARSFAMLPARDYVRACALAGGIVNGDDAREGMRKLGRDMPASFSTSWLGRNFSRLLKPSPEMAFRFVERTRDLVANYGHYRVELLGNRQLMVHLYDEYSWVDTLMRGGCEGLLDACRVRGTVDVDTDGPYRARFLVEWEERDDAGE